MWDHHTDLIQTWHCVGSSYRLNSNLALCVVFHLQHEHYTDQIQAWHNGVETARQSSLKWWERAIVIQMKTGTGTVWMARLGTLIGGVGHMWAFLIAQIPSWTELNWSRLAKQVEKVSIWNQLPVVHFTCWCSPWNFWRQNITFLPLSNVALRCCSVLNTGRLLSVC